MFAMSASLNLLGIIALIGVFFIILSLIFYETDTGVVFFTLGIIMMFAGAIGFVLVQSDHKHDQRLSYLRKETGLNIVRYDSETAKVYCIGPNGRIDLTFQIIEDESGKTHLMYKTVDGNYIPIDSTNISKYYHYSCLAQK